MAFQNRRGDSRYPGGGFRSGSGRTETANVFAPYNFVPFPQNPVYLKDESTIVGHNVLADTTDDGEKLFSGEIRYTLESMTPIFVDDGTEQHRFCRNAAGDYIIPGSTMRGLIRSNAMVLGLGNVRDEIDDYSLMYRNVANGLNKKRYGDILGAAIARMRNSDGKEYTLSVLKNVQAGYIEKTEDGKYIIYRTVLDPADGKGYAIDQNLGRMNYYTLSERFVIEQYLKNKGKYTADPDSFPFSLLIPEMQDKMMNQARPFREEYDRRGNLSYKGTNNLGYIPYHIPVAYKVHGNRNISALKSPKKSGVEGFEKGEFVSTGFIQKKKIVYVIPEIDESRIALKLSERDVSDFKVDYKRRINSITLEKKSPYRINKDDKKIQEYKDFFNLPEETGEEGRKPVFYIQYGGRCYFGFTPRLRLFYDNTVADGISKNHIPRKIDYVKAIFGYTSTPSAEKNISLKNISDTRKTRVSFSDAVLVGQEKELPLRYLTLSEPRPTDCLNYLDQSDGETSYNSNRMQLRGAKQYWLHRNADPGTEAEKQNKKLYSILNPLDSGSIFQGTIRFKNLSRYELGLFLWSIRLENNSWMNIGKAKSFGYGAVKLTLHLARCLDLKKAYGIDFHQKIGVDKASILLGDPYKELAVEELINSYKLQIRKYNGNRDIMTLPLIRDFFAMKDSTRIPDGEATKYMTLEQFQDQTRAKAPLPKPLEVIAKNPGMPSVVENSVSKICGVAGTSVGIVNKQGENGIIDAVVFLAGYPLSDFQKEKLEEISGFHTIQIKEWPNDENVVKYARQYKGIALPSNAFPKIIENSKRHCEKVFKANRNGRFDDGWTVLQ